MSSRRELEQELDKLPPNPYKPTADLREVHRLFHEASKIDEGVPHTIYPDLTDEEIGALIEANPTNLSQALKLLEDIRHEAFSSDYHPDVLRLALRIYLDHYPPRKIDHKY